MAIETDEDRAIFFDADEFGVIASVSIDGGVPFDVVGNFDAPSLSRGVQQDNQYRKSADLTGQVPTFRAPTAALIGVKAGNATLTIKDPFTGISQLWDAHDVKPDGLGTTTVRLVK